LDGVVGVGVAAATIAEWSFSAGVDDEVGVVGLGDEG